MDQELKDQIRSKMQEKDTQELITIWKKNDQTEWHEEAFDVIREILLKRTGELPAQGPVADAESASAEEPDEQDVSYNYNRLTAAAHWASTLSWWLLGLGLVYSAAQLLYVVLVRGSLTIVGLVASVAMWLLVAAVVAFFFVLLQVIAEGVWLLIDIEENTRKSLQRQAG